MKNVLFITYYFPPAGGPGVQRAFKFAKYLSLYDWKPIVLTVKKDNYPDIDESLLEEIPSNLEIYRTNMFDPYKIYRRTANIKKGKSVDIFVTSSGGKKNFKEKLAYNIRTWFFIPDARIGWLPFALNEAKRIIREHKIDIIFTTCPPHSVHLIGYYLHKQFPHIPWITDFRDLWIDYVRYIKRPWLSYQIDRSLEHKVYKKANKIITVSRGFLRRLVEKYPMVNPNKISLITNGYDEMDFDGIERHPTGKFTLTYTGSLHGKRSPIALFKALGELFKEIPEFKIDFRMIIAGRYSAENEKLFNSEEFSGLIDTRGYLAHKDVIQLIMDTEVLFSINVDAPQNDLVIPGKIFEYIATGRPIIAMTPPQGALAEILKSAGMGIVIGYDDIEGVKQALLVYYKQWKNGKLEVPNECIIKAKRWERKNLTRKLAEVFNKIMMK